MSRDAERQTPPSLSGVHELIERQVSKSPDAIAVLFGDYEITYKELNIRSNQLAHYLRKLGAGPSSPVAVSLERGPEQTASVLAVWKSGAACVPIDPTYPRDRRDSMFEISGAKICIGSSRLLTDLTQRTLKVVAVDCNWPEIDSESEDDLVSIGSPSDPCYIIFTSGSTGTPKGVVMPHAPLLNLTNWHLLSSEAPGTLDSGRRRPSTTLQFAPITFDVSFQEILSTWSSGGTLVLVDENTRLDPEALLEYIEDHRIQTLYLPVVVLSELAEAYAAGGRLPTVLRDVITAGETLHITPAITKFFSSLNGCQLHNHYGPSETHVVTAYTLDGSPDTWPTFPPIGKPIWNTSIEILDQETLFAAPGCEGELYLGGDCLASGYASRPDLTTERFVNLETLSKEAARKRLYKTGDLVRLNGDGNLEYLGRIDQQIKIRGYRVEPGEIESALRRHPLINQASVVAKSNESSDKSLVAYLIAAPGGPPPDSELRTHLRRTLPDYMVPAHFRVLERLPLTSSGKIDRKLLTELPLNQHSTGVQAVFGSKGEETVAEVWREILRHDNFGTRDSFFEIGGNSILAVRLHRALKEKLGQEFPITALFEHSTVENLYNFLLDSGKIMAVEFDIAPVSPTAAGIAAIDRLRRFRRSN